MKQPSAASFDDRGQRMVLERALDYQGSLGQSEDVTLNAISEFLHCFESAERPHQFLQMAWTDGWCGSLFWRAIQAHWSSFDRIPHHEYQELFEAFKHEWKPRYLAAEARRTFDRLKRRSAVRAYRGQDAASPVGLSWSLSRSVAEGFAKGHRGLRNHDPVVLEALIDPKCIAFLSLDRCEEEIVLFGTSSMKITIEASLSRNPL